MLTHYDVQAVRSEFPALDQEVHGHRLAYLDNAATTQRPETVLQAMDRHQRHDNANVHRGVHTLSQRATDAYEAARGEVADFLGAGHDELVWTRGTTEAINLVAQSHVRPMLGAGDEVLITEMEHHSNIVPWQLVTQATGATLRVAPIKDDGSLDMDAFANALGPQTKFVSAVHVSNALGTINPVREMTEMAHDAGATILIDGAQALAHAHVDVRGIGCDFYATSAHKMYGPTGIGGLYGRKDLLDAMPPYQGGGDMIKHVTFDRTVYNDVPFKFEAGTPNIVGAIGFGAACQWLAPRIQDIAAHEHDLLDYATRAFQDLPVELIGTAPEKAAVLSWTMNAHPHDVGSLLDAKGIAVRAGHHCAQPVMQHFGIPATTRASFGAYNTRDEVDRLVAAVEEIGGMFA